MSMPFVAAVMVTGKDTKRVPLAKAAIEAFRRQTYPNKTMVIVTTDEQELELEGNETILRVESSETLGGLRNIGLKAARQLHADFVVQWDDDDWYHEHRIAYQMAGIAAGYCTLLRYQVRYDLIANNAFIFCWNYSSCPGIPGTILHPLSAEQSYCDRARGEDELFIQHHFKNRCVVLDNKFRPQFYLRLVHESNTWDQQHIMQQMPNYSVTRDTWHLPRYVAQYLMQVLEQYYGIPVLKRTVNIAEPAIR